MLLTLKSTLDHIGSNAIYSIISGLGYLESYWIASWIQKHVICFYVRICVIFKVDDWFILFSLFPNYIQTNCLYFNSISKFCNRMHRQILSANAPNKMSCKPKDTRYGWCKWLQECSYFHFYQYSEQCSNNINRFYLAWSVLQSWKYCTAYMLWHIGLKLQVYGCIYQCGWYYSVKIIFLPFKNRSVDNLPWLITITTKGTPL